MFFLGSFNSAIPYIVYLSVVWAFMLIGMSGGLPFFRNAEHVNPDHQISVYQPGTVKPHSISSDRNIAFNWMAVVPDSGPPRFIVPYGLNYLPGIAEEFIWAAKIPIFKRGPPVYFC